MLFATVGALARTLVPYLETLRDNPETSFDRKFLVPPTVSCVIALITLPLALSALPKELMESAALSTSGLVAVFLAVWGATDVARQGQKVFSAMFISTGKEKGQGLVEYALLLVLVARVVIVILAVVGPMIGDVFLNIVSNI